MLGRTRSSGLPSREVLQTIAAASYESNPPPSVDGYTLVHSDGTLKFYRKGHDILVGVRGTWDAADLAADAALAVGKLRSSHRFRHDRDILEEFQHRFPKHTYTYYGVGHSLGGALLDQFLHDGYMREGLSFNPAIQPADIRAGVRHHRVYHEDDPLYKLEGQFAPGSSKVERETRPWYERLYNMTAAGRLYQSLKAHQLSNFS